jgi:DNA-directed RNA polymerase specialized sigma24 family protein
MTASTIANCEDKVTPLEAYAMMQSMVLKIYATYRGLNFLMPKEDFVQEAISHFLEKGYFKKFNSSITNKVYFVYVGMRNFAIDTLRKSSGRRKYFVEVSEVVWNGTSVTSVYDLTGDPKEFSAISYMILEEALSVLDKKNGLPGKYFETDLFGTVWLCDYCVFKMALTGMIRVDISRVFRVTQTTVGNYLKRARQTILKQYFGS